MLHFNNHKYLSIATIGEDDFIDLQEQMVPVIAGWYTIGLGLRLHIEILKVIEMDCSSPMECMDKVLKSWLRRRYNVRRFGEPTWRTLVQVVAHPAAGNNPKLALEIAGKHLGNLAYTIQVLEDHVILQVTLLVGEKLCRVI